MSLIVKRKIFYCTVVVAFLAGLLGLIAIWRVSRVLNSSRTQVSNASMLPMSLSVVRPVHSRFESFASPADFRSAAVLGDALFVCGPSALYRFDSSGRQTAAWYLGKELPSVPLTVLAVRRGIGVPELWLGTLGGGVLIYDGEIFHQLLPASVNQRKISALLPLSDGRMLLGTPDAGLLVTDGTELRLFHPQFASAQITSLAGDEDSVWVGTRSEGVWLWHGGQVARFLKELPDPQVLSIAADGRGAWVGTALGVAEFVHGSFKRLLTRNYFAHSVGKNGDWLYVGTIDEGLLKLNVAEQQPRLAPIREEPSASQSPVDAFAFFGTHLLSVSARSVRALPSGEDVVNSNAARLSAAHITAVHADDTNRLWIGYFDRGLDILPLRDPGRVSHFEEDRIFCINRIKSAPDGTTTAVATANGLALFDRSGHVRQVLDRNNGLIASHVTDVLFGQNNGDMIMATPAGLSFLRDRHLNSIYAFEGLVNNHVYTLAAHADRLMAGTLGGISLLKNEIVQTSYTTANSQLPQNWITASAEAWGDTYMGTYGSGVCRLSAQGDFSFYREFSSNRKRIEINPNAMLASSRALYAGTTGQGLAVLQRGSERWTFVTDGLPSLSVTALDQKDGEVYVGTDNGLVRIAELDLLEH